MYGVYSRAITKGRNNPDPNIEDLICVRSNQWCIRTQDSIKCKKLYTGLDRRILTCYNNMLYPGVAQMVARMVRDHEAMGSNPVTPTIKNTHALFALCVFYLPVIRDLNGTLRKQHSALFLVPGVIATALAAQKRRIKRLRP